MAGTREERMARLKRQIEAALVALEGACELLAQEMAEALSSAGCCPNCGAGCEQALDISTMGADNEREMYCRACKTMFTVKGGGEDGKVHPA